MNRLIAKTRIMVLFITFLSIGLFSCRKESPTIVIITAVDTSGNLVPNAMVRLYPSPTITPPRGITIDDTVYTNANGQAFFDYTDRYNLGQAGFAVLNIEISSGQSLYGTGIIKIEPETTSEEKVILVP